jgi:hypothetical protein
MITLVIVFCAGVARCICDDAKHNEAGVANITTHFREEEKIWKLSAVIFPFLNRSFIVDILLSGRDASDVGQHL